MDAFGQTSGSPFSFGNLFASKGFEGGMKGLGALSNLGFGIFNALGQRDFFKHQKDLQNKEFAMNFEAFNRNKKREDMIANLDFTQGQRTV